MFVDNNADGYGYGCNSGPGFGSLDSWLSKAVKKVSKITTALLKDPVGTVVNTIVSPVGTTTTLWDTTGYNITSPVKTATPPIEYTQIAQAAATQQTVPNAPIPTPIQAAQAAAIVNASVPVPTITQIGAVAQQIAEGKVVTVPQVIPPIGDAVELSFSSSPTPNYLLWGGAALLLVLLLRR